MAGRSRAESALRKWGLCPRRVPRLPRSCICQDEGDPLPGQSSGRSGVSKLRVRPVASVIVTVASGLTMLSPKTSCRIKRIGLVAGVDLDRVGVVPGAAGQAAGPAGFGAGAGRRAAAGRGIRHGDGEEIGVKADADRCGGAGGAGGEQSRAWRSGRGHGAWVAAFRSGSKGPDQRDGQADHHAEAEVEGDARSA